CGGRVVFDSGATWRLLQCGDGFLFTFQSSLRSRGVYRTARFDRRFTAGDVELSSSYFDEQRCDGAYALQYPLDELLMIHQLAQGKGVELHGAGVLDRAQRAWVFAGHSGAGKSTIAPLWTNRPDVTLLSDERVVLRTDGESIVAYGTPWHGDACLTSPLCGRLAGVFFLHHGSGHETRPIAPPLAAARLFSCAFLPFHTAGGVDST